MPRTSGFPTGVTDRLEGKPADPASADRPGGIGDRATHRRTIRPSRTCMPMRPPERSEAPPRRTQACVDGAADGPTISGRSDERHRRKKSWRSRSVSRVLYDARAPRQSFLWDRGYPRPQATYPGATRATS